MKDERAIIKTLARERLASLRAIIADCDDRDIKRYVYTELARIVANLSKDLKPQSKRRAPQNA